MRTDNRSLTPTLAEVIQTAIDANLIDMHVCLPAKIVKYDSDTQTATILPSLLKTYENDLTLPWPPIPNVPIVFPRAAEGQAYIHMPLIPGDDVTMLICERSLDNWKETGMLADPDDRRQFDITDAFAFPGGSAAPLAFSVEDAMAIEMSNFLSAFQLKPDGTAIIKNEVVTVTVGPSSVTIDAPMVKIGTGASHGVGLGDVIEMRLTALENALSTFLISYDTHTHATAAPGPPSPPLPPASPFVPVPTPAASVTVEVST